jgi:hypothetical protein
MFCAPGVVFGCTEGVDSDLHVLCSRTRFLRYRGRQLPFSFLARPDSFSAISKSSGLVFKFCAHRLVFGGAECVGSRFHILRARTRFQRYRGRQVPFSCFALPNSFKAVPRASGPVFLVCAPGYVFGGTEDVVSRFHVLRARTRFRRTPGFGVPFSCFAIP